MRSPSEKYRIISKYVATRIHLNLIKALLTTLRPQARQERYLAYANPKPVVVAPQTQVQPQANTAGGGFDISNLLKLIQTGTQQQQQQSTPPPPPVQQAASQAPVSDLERTINMFRQQQAPQLPQVPQVPPVPQIPANQPPPSGVDFQGILNVMKQMQQPTVVPQPQQTQSALAPNLGAIFSQFTGQNQQDAAPQTSQQAYTYEDPERKRMREGGPSENQYDSGSYTRQKRTKANDAKPVSIEAIGILSQVTLLTPRTVQVWIGSLQVLGRREVQKRRQLHLPPRFIDTLYS